MEGANVAQTNPVTYSLYVGDLRPDVTEEQLIRAFTEFPSIASVRVCKDSRTDTSLGYGYVNFNDAHDGICHRSFSCFISCLVVFESSIVMADYRLLFSISHLVYLH